MINQAVAVVPQPFFLEALPGRRFCLYYPPTGICRGSVLYVHPFAEEMNKSRRTVALQARELASCGYAILMMDLFGCGDSSGDFAEARWSIWLQDLAVAVAWLKRESSAPISLWGLRLGVPLMLDYARVSGEAFQQFILWQPVLTGQHYLTQFLRLRLAQGMLSGDEGQTSVQDLRHALATGSILEIAGYHLAPALAATLDELQLGELAGAGGVYHWFEVAQSEKPLAPASEKVLAAWVEQGVNVTPHQIQGETFWQSTEITVCPDLIAATTRLLTNEF